MKTIFTILLLVTSLSARAQFTGDWYAFRIGDMVRYTVTSEHVIITRIDNFNSPKSYIAGQDTYNIVQQHFLSDTVLYLVKHPEAAPEEMSMDKFIYNPASRHLTGFFFYTLYEFQVWLQQKGPAAVAELTTFIANDTSQTGYVTFYRESDIKTFLGYTPLTQQPRETIITLYQEMAAAYRLLKQQDEKETMPYFALKGMSKSAIRVPFLLKHHIYPLLLPSDMDELSIKEQYKDDREVLRAVYEFELALK